MSFTDTFIRRPVLATVISLVILLVGLVSYRELHVREFPTMQTSVITIETGYLGASAALMESFVSTRIENAIASVDGLDYITSSNSQGISIIYIYLKEGYDINTVINDVSDKVASIRGMLPNEITDPVIAKQDPNSSPTIFISFSSQTMSPEAITDYVTRVVRPEFEALDGVGSARIFGERQYAMRVWLDPNLMTAHKIAATDVTNALRNNHVQTTAGRIETPTQEFNINVKTDLNTAEQFNNLVIKEQEGSLIRIRDIGQAELGPNSNRASTLVNGKKTVVLGIIPKSTANPLDISREARKLLPTLQSHLPNALQAHVTWDSSKFIRESIREVYKTLIEACLFVVAVIFLFLGSSRAVLIPAVTIPLSLIGVCAFMLAMNFTVNTLTLLAWVLAIGMVVDDAIVVLENIHRHIESGMKPLEASLLGAKEIRFAVIAMTLTLAAVYAPIGFTKGLTGTLFREFAFVLAGAVIISGVIALTLSPMLCSKIFKDHHQENKFQQKLNIIYDVTKMYYRKLLQKIVQQRRLILITAAIIYGLCIWLWISTPAELAPTEDRGALMGIAMGPISANLKFTEKYSAEIAQIYNTVPEKEGYVLINGFPDGVKSALSFLILKPWSERSRSTAEIRQSLFPAMWSIPGLNAFPVELPPLPVSGGRTPIEFVLKTTADYRDLNKAMQKLLQAVKTNPRFLNPDSSLKLNKPEVQVNIDRNKAGDLGISMLDIASTLNVLLTEQDVTRFMMNGRGYDVITELYPQYHDKQSQLNNLYVRTRSNTLMPLSNIVELKNTLAPESLKHFQQLRAATLTASLVPGYTLGEALTYLIDTAKKELPPNIQFDFAGQSRQFIEASGAMMQTFIFAVIFIYLVLAAQFESFRDPLIVMASVPLSLTGALIAMRLTGSTMNIYTQIGLVTLIGLISKHGILMVEFANQLKSTGLSATHAIIEAAATRFRPILMTTAAMILGALPLAIATGAGAGSRQQIGWVIVGGMAFGTMLTLFVVPVVYLSLTNKK